MIYITHKYYQKQKNYQ